MRLVLLFSLAIPLGLDLYMPVPEENPITAEKVELGRSLFEDPRLSGDGTISCSSCHDPRKAFSDGRQVAVGISGRLGRRNAPAIINRGYGRLFFWDGRASNLEEQVLEPIANPNEMGSAPEEAGRRVGQTVEGLSRALASYVRSILSGNSRYDRFVSGDRSALSTDEISGLRIFRNKGNCTACHVGPTFTDERLHNTGVAWQTALDDREQSGRFLDQGGGAGQFKTPTLREVSKTAPYMHDGSFDTLDAVVEFYSNGGRPNSWIDVEIKRIDLTGQEKRELVAFLKTLSGEMK